MEGVQVDGKEDADGQQKQLGRFVDAEPQDHQRNQGQRGDVAHHLQGRVEQGFRVAEAARQ
ncbi:hypothetical protein D3C72_2397660 [compost metagenome]